MNYSRLVCSLFIVTFLAGCGYPASLKRVVVTCTRYGSQYSIQIDPKVLLQRRSCYYEYTDCSTLSLFSGELADLDTLRLVHPDVDWDIRYDGRILGEFEYIDGHRDTVVFGQQGMWVNGRGYLTSTPPSSGRWWRKSILTN